MNRLVTGHSPREPVEGGRVDPGDLVVVERQPRHLRVTYSMYYVLWIKI